MHGSLGELLNGTGITCTLILIRPIQELLQLDSGAGHRTPGRTWLCSLAALCRQPSLVHGSAEQTQPILQQRRNSLGLARHAFLPPGTPKQPCSVANAAGVRGLLGARGAAVLARSDQSQLCQRAPAASPSTAGRPPSRAALRWLWLQPLPDECVGWRNVSQPPEPCMRAAAQRCLAAAPRGGAMCVVGERGGMQALGCIDPAAKMPSNGESSWGNTVVTIFVTAFFLKLQAIQRAALGSCFCMLRLDFCTMAGPGAFSFLPFALSPLGKSRLHPVCRSCLLLPCRRPAWTTLTLPPWSLLSQDSELGIGLIWNIWPST